MKNVVYRLLKKPFFGKLMRPWHWPENANKDEWQQLFFKSDSGAQISALLAPAHTNPVKGVVLMCHPMGAVAKGFWIKYGHAELLRESGYNVMLMDLNGFGESSSTNMDFPLDILAAGNQLENIFPNLPIAVMGSSMGGAMGVCALSHHNHPFRAAIIESAFPTLMHFWGKYPIPKLALKLVRLLYPAGELRLRPIEAAHNIVHAPATLLIYGDADKYTPPKDGMLLFNGLKEKTQTEFWQVSGARHTHAYAAQPEEYAKTVIGFLDQKLLDKSRAITH